MSESSSNDTTARLLVGLANVFDDCADILNQRGVQAHRDGQILKLNQWQGMRDFARLAADAMREVALTPDQEGRIQLVDNLTLLSVQDYLDASGNA